MPPKVPLGKTQGKGRTPKSQDVVPVGPRELVSGYKGKRAGDGLRPTTARALILRNGKNGARGSGELVIATRIAGREKLDLLAEDLMQKYSQALGQPFKLDKALKLAESQFMTFLDDVTELQDHELFYDKIGAEVLARQPPQKGANAPDPFKNATYVAQVIASRIHNSYMLASAWKIIGITLTSLDIEDSTIKEHLKKNPQLRARYLVLYDLVNIINDATQKRFSQLAISAPHWRQYFRQNPLAGPDESEFVFEWGRLKGMHKSFLDSIVLELCLPHSPYPKKVLYQILSEAIEEDPRDAKQFSQALWDSIGDLSVGVELQELIEAPLLGAEGEKWKNEPRQMPPEYEKWVDAQIFSENASKDVINYKDNIHPLEKTKTRAGLDGLWRYINIVYQSVTGKTIDTLWMLDDCKKRTPTWHAIYVPKSQVPEAEAVPKKTVKKKPLAITNGDETDDSLPGLMSCSDSSEADALSDYSGDESSDEEREDDENGYDTDEEDQLRELLREAMDVAAADPDFYDPHLPALDFEELAKDREGNPFLKLLGNLRGRMVSGDLFLKTTNRTEPRHPYANARAPPPPPGASGNNSRVSNAAKEDKPTEPRSMKATIEEVLDEDELKAAKKKKKKKPKKKKSKKKTTDVAGAEDEGDDDEEEEEEAKIPTKTASPEPVPQAVSSVLDTATPVKQSQSPSRSKPKPKPKQTPPSRASGSTLSLPTFGASTTSLPLPTEQNAQSSHKYLRSEGLLDQGKSKPKTRGKDDTLDSIPEKKEKKSFFSRFLKKEKVTDEEEQQGNKRSFFKRMTKKAQNYMHQLLNTSEDEKQGQGSMKWEHFLTVMREMGFSYDPSTAGSSVRFDPPDPRDPSITFHKPHPDPTITRVRLKQYSKRLKEKYGWSEQDFLSAVSS